MAKRKPLPPGWEEYQVTSEDGAPYTAALLRRSKARATWREAWQEAIDAHEKHFADAAVLLDRRGCRPAAERLRSQGAKIRQRMIDNMDACDENGLPLRKRARKAKAA